VRQQLATQQPAGLELPVGFGPAAVCLPGILAIQGPSSKQERGEIDLLMEEFCEFYRERDSFEGFPLIVICDDCGFAAATLNNFLWITFTRSNPAVDIYGIRPVVRGRHWGCNGALVIDARVKPFHAPALMDDPDVERKIDALAAPGAPLHGIF
jgi:4-hydroxy-3-polyprenylbenzoate decarboxylase